MGGQKRGLGTKYKREEMKLGLSFRNTFLTSLNIGISSIHVLRSCLVVTKHQPSDIFMNFFIIPYEIQEINKQGNQNNL